MLLVRHEIDGCNLGHFACKRVPVGDDHAWLEKVLVEVELLANLAHPNLVSYRHVWLEDVQLTRFGPSVACAFILQQYCNGGDLLQYVIGDKPKEATKEELKAQMRRRSRGQTERPQVQKRLAPEEIYTLFKDITSGLSYLHAANYIHRDLKPSNCLLHQDGNQLKCLISDFGEVQPENAVRKSTGSTGTISYCAPEVLKMDASGRYGNFTTKSDVFSLGMILYFMCFGRLPYVNANSVQEELEDVDQLRAEISHWKGFQEERKARPDLPSKLYQLLSRLLAVNPADRPAASEIMGAMGGEYSFDSMMRGSRNTSPLLGLSGQRVQNLDSPMPPSTPVPGLSPPSPHSHQSTHQTKLPDPTKHARVSSAADEDLPSPFSRAAPESSSSTQPSAASNLLARRLTLSSTAASRHPRSPTSSHTMTLSRSNRSHNHNHNNPNSASRTHSPTTHRTPSHSPQRTPQPRTPNVINSVTISPATATLTTPLLMAPPMTRTARLRLQFVLAVMRVARWVDDYAMVLRLVLFAGKVLSLSWVCWPYSAGLAVMVGVVAVGAGDLYLGSGREDGGGDGVGGGRGDGRREGEGGDGVGRSRAGSGGLNGLTASGGPGLGLIGPDDSTSEGSEVGQYGSYGWPGGWWRSLVLLVVHCLVVGLTSRAGVMCAGGWAGRAWGDW